MSYSGTRSLDSRLAMAVNEAHYYLCCVNEGISSPLWAKKLERRLAIVLEEAEQAGWLKDIEDDETYVDGGNP